MRPDGARRTIVVGALALILFLGLVIGLRASQQRDFAFATYPVKSMHYVEANGLLGTRLLTSDSDAGYVILEYSPEQRVFMDDRYDMYPTKLIYDYFTGRRRQARLERSPRSLPTSRRSCGSQRRALAAELDASPKWQRVHRDQARAVWVRVLTPSRVTRSRERRTAG